MRIAFVGKGGSGKTTLAALFVRHLAALGATVLAIDADINQHLAQVLGVNARLPEIGNEQKKIKEYVRGTNQHIASADAMIKTTPPGVGSRFIYIRDDDPILQELSSKSAGFRILATGAYTNDDIGVSCYHSKTGAVELLLNHLIDKKDEYVVVDMTAGADAFSSSLFTRFDLLVLVTEPTVQSVSVFHQYEEYRKNFTVPIVVLGNKIDDQDDIEFLTSRIPHDRIVGHIARSKYVRNLERGVEGQLTLEVSNMGTIARLKVILDSKEKDWEAYHKDTVRLHLKNAEGWANAAMGVDLSLQIDEDFRLSAYITQTYNQ